MADIIQIRRDTAANWTSADPTLANGEMGRETDTGKLKFGDGVTAWTSLSYFSSAETNDLETDGAAGIAVDEIVVGTGAGTAAYKKISTLTEEASPATGDWVLVEESGGALRKVDFGGFSDFPLAANASMGGYFFTAAGGLIANGTTPIQLRGDVNRSEGMLQIGRSTGGFTVADNIVVLYDALPPGTGSDNTGCFRANEVGILVGKGGDGATSPAAHAWVRATGWSEAAEAPLASSTSDDQGGTILRLAAGPGTGEGTLAAIEFWTADPNLLLGNAEQLLQKVAEISPTTGALRCGDFSVSNPSAYYDVLTEGFVNAKGDLIVADGSNSVVRLPVGTNGYVLSADSTEASGLKWVSSGGGGDNVSVNGTAATDVDLDDATPAAPAGDLNVKWQKDTSAPDNVSAYVDVSVLEPLVDHDNLNGGTATIAHGATGAVVGTTNTQILTNKDLTATTNKARHPKPWGLETPGSSENAPWFRTDRAITVASVKGVLVGGSSPSVTYQVMHSTDRSGAGTGVTNSTVLTNTTTGATATLNDATIPANSYVWVKTTAASGSPDWIELDMVFTDD